MLPLPLPSLEGFPWAEIYLPPYGWIPVDANAGDRRWPADQAAAFGALSARFLITTASPGPSPTLGWRYNYNLRWSCRGRCHTSLRAFAEWSPLLPPPAPPPALPTPLPLPPPAPPVQSDMKDKSLEGRGLGPSKPTSLRLEPVKLAPPGLPQKQIRSLQKKT